ncbi:WhiB family transcriptional regulator [Streptomyces sp. NPDC002838]|uniref:WhiB family transcriptional regulator n=1 Tax=Streptomyces sp. NPDC002838 TaxID=3154436 RepID=UPI003316B4F4
MTASHQAPHTLANALAWAEDASCRGYDLDLFFTDSKRGIAQAKQVCAGCPVREECLDEGLRAEDGSRYGIYGGLTPDERAELAKDPPRTGRKTAPCGTPAAHRRHVKNKEPIDDACRTAKREADRRWRATGSTKAP